MTVRLAALERVVEAAKVLLAEADRMSGEELPPWWEALRAALALPREEAPVVECDPCCCRKAVPGLWTSGYSAERRSFVRHASVECVEYVRFDTAPAPLDAAPAQRPCPICKQPEVLHAKVWSKGSELPECPPPESAPARRICGDFNGEFTCNQWPGHSNAHVHHLPNGAIRAVWPDDHPESAPPPPCGGAKCAPGPALRCALPGCGEGEDADIHMDGTYGPNDAHAFRAPTVEPAPPQPTERSET